MNDSDWMAKAIELSRKCPKTGKSFAVGALLVDSENNLIATGYSLELGPSWHAEEVALHKAREQKSSLKGATLYSTLEPCCPRLSGKTCCSDLIIEAEILRVVFAVHEPPVFVDCKGEERLCEKGIEVVILSGFADQVREINSQLF